MRGQEEAEGERGALGLALQLQTCWNWSVLLKKTRLCITFRSADFFIGCNSVSKCQGISNPRVSIATCLLHHEDLFVKIIIFPHLALLTGEDFAFTQLHMVAVSHLKLIVAGSSFSLSNLKQHRIKTFHFSACFTRAIAFALCPACTNSTGM